MHNHLRNPLLISFYLRFKCLLLPFSAFFRFFQLSSVIQIIRITAIRFAQPSAKSAVNQLLSAVQMFASAVFSLFPLLSAFFSGSKADIRPLALDFGLWKKPPAGGLRFRCLLLPFSAFFVPFVFQKNSRN